MGVYPLSELEMAEWNDTSVRGREKIQKGQWLFKCVNFPGFLPICFLPGHPQTPRVVFYALGCKSEPATLYSAVIYPTTSGKMVRSNLFKLDLFERLLV
jgi:hypothetical protein